MDGKPDRREHIRELERPVVQALAFGFVGPGRTACTGTGAAPSFQDSVSGGRQIVTAVTGVHGVLRFGTRAPPESMAAMTRGQAWHASCFPSDREAARKTTVTAGSHMGLLRGLLASDHRQTLDFFIVGLRDVSGPSVDRQELLYNASVLAHFAQVSTQAHGEIPAPATLVDVFDNFVLDTTLRLDGTMMETAGAQCLLLAGFFEEQMRQRHSIRWYVQLGAGFFTRAAVHEQSSPKARLLRSIAGGFEAWRQRHERLSRELHDRQYLLTPPGSASPM